MSPSPAIRNRTRSHPRYWLMKSEPDEYSIDDLRCDQTAPWSGVRNYQARNYMRDDMRVGDLVLFYHSNAHPPGVAGVAEINRPAYPDASAWDPKSPYFDAKTRRDQPVWLMVEVKFREKFKTLISLDMIRCEPGLKDMLVLKRGMRLSIQPVDPSHFNKVMAMGRQPEKQAPE